MGKTNDKDFQRFKKYCWEYQMALGLSDWKLYFDHKQDDDRFAWTYADSEHRRATICLNKEWDAADRPKNEYGIRRTAFHEMLHVLMAELYDLGTARFVQEAELRKVEEATVMRIENYVLELEA